MPFNISHVDESFKQKKPPNSWHELGWCQQLSNETFLNIFFDKA